MNKNQVRFFAKIAKRNVVAGLDKCWLWTGSLNDGYGRFRFGASVQLVHRLSWEFHNGKIPYGLNVLHRCDVRNCCNPDHLWLGSQSENCMDKTLKGRSQRKLTKLDIQEILKMPGSNNSISKKYLVSASMIGKIKSGKRWKTLPEIEVGPFAKVRRNTAISV
jgi:hypothetical protein